MHEEEDLKWIDVPEQKLGRDNSSRGRYRGGERASTYRGSYRERTRTDHQEVRSLNLSSRGVRRERERSPRETFRYRERGIVRRSEPSRNGREEITGQTRVLEHGEKVINLEECSDDASQKKEEKEKLVPCEDSLDLANEVLEAMNITEGDEGMEVDEKDVPNGMAEKTTDADEEFQDLTDEESGVKGDINPDSAVVGEITGEEESKEEGEVERDAAEGEVVKKHGAKKKAVKAGIAGAGGTTKKRFVNAMLHGKRTSGKTSSRHEEGSKKMEERGSLNPKPSISK